VAAPACSFCAKSQAQVKKLIGGPGGLFICEGCVALCVDSLTENGIELPVVVRDDEWDVGGGVRARTAHVVAQTEAPTRDDAANP
jgi:ATP-dependent protease Clp ATPase subunit